jgi:hypothetical protein
MRADGRDASLTASREAAESEAAKLFSLSDFHRRRLLLEERRWELWFNRAAGS